VSHVTIEVQGIVEDKSLQSETYPRALEDL